MDPWSCYLTYLLKLENSFSFISSGFYCRSAASAQHCGSSRSSLLLILKEGFLFNIYGGWQGPSK